MRFTCRGPSRAARFPVAEGVETLRQHHVLVELGCDELQGFLFAKSMTARALLLWAMDDRSSSAVCRDSLFGVTREASRHPLRPPSRQGSRHAPRRGLRQT